MRLGGWMRIWIVLSILLGIFIVLLAYDSRPTRERIINDWYQSASDVIAEKISDAEDRYVSPSEVRDAYVTASEQENIKRLKKWETSPSENAKIFSNDIGRINRSHEQKLQSLAGDTAIFWTKTIGLWLAISALLFLAGWTVGWVVRGFRSRAA